MLRFRNLIFQTAPLVGIALSTHPISGYLPVWNAVCFIYSNPDESSCIYTFEDGICGTTRILADKKGSRFDFCQYCLYKERFLNYKPPKRSNLILQHRNQWRNSKVCGSRSSSQLWLKRVKIFFKFATSHSPWAYSREYSPWQASLLYSYRYFPHQTWNKAFEMVLLTHWVWNQNNRHVYEIEFNYHIQTLINCIPRLGRLWKE